MQSIKTKVYGWLLISFLLTLAVFLFIFEQYLDRFYLSQSEQKTENLHSSFQQEIGETLKSIEDVSKSLAIHTDVIAVTNFVNNYQDIENYDVNTFDTEKKTLIPVLKSFMSASDIDGAVILAGTKSKIPIAFAGNRVSKIAGNGYVSYQNGQERLVSQNLNSFAKKTIEKLVQESTKPDNINFHFMKVGDYLLIVFHTPIYKTSRKGKKTQIGTLKTFKAFNGDIIKNFAQKRGVEVELKIRGDLLSSAGKFLSSRDYYIHKKTIAIGDIRYNVIYGISKKKMRGEFASLEISITILFLLFALITLPLFVTIFNKEIIAPLNKLLHFGELIKESKHNRIDGVSNLEFNHVVNTFNDMSDSIVKRENSLRATINSLDEYKKAVDHSSVVSKGDIKGVITYVNDLFCQTTGYKRSELLGKPHSLLRDPDVDSKIFEDMWYIIKQKKRTWAGYLSNRKKNGEIFYIKLTITPFLDESGDIIEFLALRENITELVESKKQLELLYSTDSLTGLYNRPKLTTDLSRVKNTNLIVINIDSFREINDFYGDKIGDILLIKFANRVEEYFKSFSSGIYRIHGDEFAVTTTANNLEELQFKTNLFITNLADSPFNVDGITINLRATAGIAGYAKEATIKNADVALKTAKIDKKDCEIFTLNNKMLKEYENNLFWTNRIKGAIADDRIVPFFQAIRNNKTGKLEKYESLVRLIKENGEVVSPFFFLNIAKKSKLYSQITEIVIEKTFAYFADKETEFSINLTFEDITNDDTITLIKNTLTKYDISQRVVFEVVESEQVESFEKLSSFITMAKSYGCKVAIDDFGTGYSNFEYLIKLQADYIKIDGSLIKDIATDQSICAVAETIVNFAKKNNFKTIAEFVASEEIQEKIEELGIDYSQGYLFGKPEEAIQPPTA